MLPLSIEQITVDEIFTDELREKDIRLSVLRLDKIHPVISGNKWFKLKYYLAEAVAKNKQGIVTFGGPYSNHIVAAAAAAKMCGLNCIGIIRGEEPSQLSPTLLQAIDYGMQLMFVSRDDFRKKKIPAVFSAEYIIPEGGWGAWGAKGATEIPDHCNKEAYTHVCCAVGTATMMAGLIMAADESQQVVGIPVLKNAAPTTPLLALLGEQERKKNFLLIGDYHFGGYAKRTDQLIGFMNDLYIQTGIPTDFVYTGKLFYGIFDLLHKNFFPGGSHILIVHSGGLQGNCSLPKGLLIF